MYQKTTFLAAFCSAALLLGTLAGCSRAEVTPSTAPLLNNCTDEQLFEGIFLMQGDIARKISLFQTGLAIMAKAEAAVPGLRAQHERQAQQLTQAVYALDPTFPIQLRRALATHDLSETETALKRGVALLETVVAAKAAARKQPDDLMNFIAPPAPGEPAPFSLTYFQCVSLNPVIVIGPPTITKYSNNSLEREIMIKELAVELF